MQTCGSGCAPRSPRPSRKPTSSCSPPSGDNNAIHINEEFAAGTIFKGRTADGMLSASVISAAIERMTKISPIDFKPELVSMMKSVLENASAYIDNESGKPATSATKAKMASRILTTSPTA
jgi:MaoC like domain